MRKQLKNKTSREFLKKDFPENITPFKKLSNKDKRIIQDKLISLKKIKKKIKRLEEVLQKKADQEKISKKKSTVVNHCLGSFSSVNTSFTKKEKRSLDYYDNPLDRQSQVNPCQEGDATPLRYGHNLKPHLGGRYDPWIRQPCFLFSSDQITNDLLQNQKHTRQASDFLLKLKEKKKFSLLYGIVSKKFFQKAFLQAKKERGRINENLIIRFETRLDTLLYRICFVKTIATARQIINHNLVSINGIKVRISSYQVRPGDIISIDVNKRKNLINQNLNNINKAINNRRFRFLISMKYLKKALNTEILSREATQLSDNNQKKVNRSQPKKESCLPSEETMLKNQEFFLPKRPVLLKTRSFLKTKDFMVDKTGSLIKNQVISRLKVKVNRLLYTTKRRNAKKRTWFLETMLRLNNINDMAQQTYFMFKNWQQKLADKYKVSLQENRKQKFLYLKLKNLMFRKHSRYHKLLALKISSMKPLNVEVSYKIMSAVVLYAPQKIAFPATINIDLLSRSITKK